MTDSHTDGAARQSLDQIPALAELFGDEGTPLAERLEGHLAVFAKHMREGLLAASTAVGLEVMVEMMAAEVDDVVGPKGRHNPGRSASRHGSDGGTVTLGGRQISIRRPRVRSADSAAEIPLETYTTFADTDLLADAVVIRMLAGLSCRRYGAGLEPVGTDINAAAKGTSRSAVSRRFIAATQDRLATLMERRLDGDRWLVVYLDGFGFGEHTLVGALGVTEDGTKVPLAVVEGTTENKIVCTRLVAGLAERGLDATCGLLFCVDGSKALSAAIRSVFGDFALIQRCRRHKERNLEGHLPAAEWDDVRRRLREAWADPNPDLALAALERLARSLDRRRPGAAASLREGMEETITVNRLGVRDTLLRTLESTNPMESMIEIVRDHSRRVKRWRDGAMALRWAAAGMACAQTQFRRVCGYRQLSDLAAALFAATADARRAAGIELDADVAIPA